MGKGLCVSQMTGDLEVFNKMTGRYEKLGHIIEPCFNWDVKDNDGGEKIIPFASTFGSMTCKINRRAYRKLMRALRKTSRRERK